VPFAKYPSSIRDWNPFVCGASNKLSRQKMVVCGVAHRLLERINFEVVPKKGVSIANAENGPFEERIALLLIRELQHELRAQ